jgi:hypothetical protein
MTQMTTAGRLLGQLYDESELTGDTIATAAGVAPDRALAAIGGDIKLTLSEQLRLSEAATLFAPRFTRQALRLRGQVLAARSHESGTITMHSERNVERWERSAQLRR